MGLDITALRRVELSPAGDDADPDAMYEQGYEFAYVGSGDFADRADGLVTGYYKGTERLDFRAGSYHGYNDWRAWLCRTMLEVEPVEVWGNPDAFDDKPFFELIHFADNEGIIGPETSKRLAQAFDVGDAKARATGDTDYYGLYRRFQQAFELAADGGLVEFH